MPSDPKNAPDSLRDRLIGLGERSMAKSYYPELRRRLDELERFRSVVDHANDAIFMFLTADWSVADVNETALLMLGLSRAEAIGAHISRFFPQEIAARYAGALQATGDLHFRNGHIVTSLSGAEGHSVPVEITVTLHSFAGTGYAVLIARDVTVRQMIEAELDKSRQLFASFMENSPAMAFIKNLSGRYVFCNPAFGECLGLPPQKIIGRLDTDIWPEDVAAMLREYDAYVQREGKPLMVQEQVRLRSGGPTRHLQVSKFPLMQNRTITGVAAIAVDITRQVQTEQALQQSEDRHRIVAEYTHGMECWIGPAGEMLYVSPSCERITGYQREHFLHNPRGLEDLVHQADLDAWRRFHAHGKDDESLDYRIRHRNGSLRWVNEVKRDVMGSGGGSMGTRISLRDITDRKEMEIQLRHLALHDPLTGLANRTLCLDRIRQAMERSRRRTAHSFSLIFLDLDRFKILNDSLGHTFGDQVLVTVADMLRKSIRSFDTVSRFGGDEFVILLEELASPREAIQAVQRIRNALRQPFSLGGHEIQLTASLGITLGGQGAETPEDLLRNANVAMHQAKKAGRNRFKAFTQAMLERASRLLVLETDLRGAISRGEFFLVYQPIVRLDNAAALHGFEALIRWRHPQNGLISPGEFIPVAEESGLIVDIGLMVLREACQTLMSWRADSPYARELVMSVNLSPRQFSDPTLVEDVKTVLAETGLPPQALKLEITETAIMDNATSAVDKLRRLKSLGMALSIDDFGTGYSSMSSLQQFPLDTLKIDLSFVQRMETGPEGLEIVKAIISLAHSLQLQVIAEGVEREVQRDLLRGLACEYAQGYLYARPLPTQEAWEYMRRSLNRPTSGNDGNNGNGLKAGRK
ncbi:PAS domain S-box-containing protein/diguanylate cyclase (GGDEF) domain-containing protein [Humidesulfovibrio mexicanus]|uniref:PAS domain S-box-containing protein/diguanylate cyclase (GGDEF) domain-containing protein n=1 Tax=Humidesulfovibrio mexicanus TaxID=147047 RepID=A0A238Z6H0_9BACT|nr:EAL domain-containing protein [Humidesulfovibrio mexicanus]SNR79017.1 PAS domain S-box-containing protein/diguanylate cyclase (GGDEF) domain-containing protein [Humidesulfovibrio mexicanus]